MRYIATIEPQAWQNDYANPVDPPGETSWDCTAFVTSDPSFRRKIDESLDQEGEFIDCDDVLKGDDAAPEWVGEWSGPFTITVDRE